MRAAWTPGSLDAGSREAGQPGARKVDARLAVSANGSELAYSTARCSATSYRRNDGQVGVINLRSGKVTTWTLKWPAQPASLSLSASGNLLEFISGRSNGTTGGGPSAVRAIWTVRTTEPSGPLAGTCRRVTGTRRSQPEFALLSPNGAVSWAIVNRVRPQPADWLTTLTAYRTADGSQIGSWPFTLRAARGIVAASADPSGRYVLIGQFGGHLVRLDLATRRFTRVPVTLGHPPFAVAW